ncbi:MAG: glutathione peroxidase [Bacteroidota bacterium]|jgi:glutathione peroxidase
MKTLLLTAILLFTTASSIHTFDFQTIDGKTMSFSSFKGKKILIVNTASKCGYTSQYEDLEKLHKEYGSKLVIIGFPANNFGGQEPGTNSDINSFCKKNYGVTFIMASKISVKGSDMNPLFKWLTSQENPDFTGDIRWNFEKFLLDENGKLVRRYRSGTNPLDKDLVNSIK